MSKSFVLCSVVAVLFAVNAQAAQTHAYSARPHTSTSSYGQPSGLTPSDDLLGFELGPSVASMNAGVPEGQTAPDSDSRTRPMLGAYYEHRFMPHFAIRPELDYLQRGFSQTQGQGASAITNDFAANYLELPVMAKGQYAIGRFLPYVLTGPYLGLCVGKGEVASTGNGPDKDISLSNAINTWELGWNFGAGSSYALTRQLNLEASFRYSLAMSNAYAQAAPNTSLKLNSLMFLAGVNFAL